TYKEKKDSNTQSETIVAEELERLEAIEETVISSQTSQPKRSNPQDTDLYFNTCKMIRGI
ncbi:hypothetical protein JG687_00017725, partial [Phytophthora cactorum]